MSAKCDFHRMKGWSSYCMKKDDYINNETYDKYCSSYRYDECPIYKQSSNSSGCYLTSACIEARSLPDDCGELTVLRNFRDTYMKKQPGGEADIAEYYKRAPKIVKQIDAQANRKDIYETIYSSVIRPCVELIEKGQNSEAYRMYKDMVLKLEQQFG